MSDAQIMAPMKRKRTVQVFDVEEWPICEYCGMPIEPNEIDWHKHHEQWLLRQRQEESAAGSKADQADDLVTRIYLSAEVLEPPKP